MARLTKLDLCYWELSMRHNRIEWFKKHGTNGMFILDYKAQCQATDLLYAFIFQYGLDEKWKRFAKKHEKTNPTQLMLELARPKPRNKSNRKQAD